MSIFSVNSASFSEVHVSGSMELSGSINISGSLLLSGEKIENILLSGKYGSLLLNTDNDTSTNPNTISPIQNQFKSYFKMNGNWINVPVTQIALSMWNYKKQAPYYFTLKDIFLRKLVGTKIILTQLESSISKVYKITNIEKSGSFIEEDAQYASESPTWIPGFFILDVEDISYNLNELPQQSYSPDEYSIDFEMVDAKKLSEKIVFDTAAQVFKYDIPSWAKTIKIIAIGGGGGGGGGVGIYRDEDYPMGDSVDLLHYNIDYTQKHLHPYDRGFTDIPFNQKLLNGREPLYDWREKNSRNASFVENNIPEEFLIYYNMMTGSIRYEAVIGGGGGAGGNVVWKTYDTTDFFPGVDSIIICAGKGGKGGKGGNGKILDRNYLDFGQDGNSEDAKFLSNNSSIKEVELFLKRFKRPVEQFGMRGQKGRTSYYIYTRSGQLNWLKNNNDTKIPYVLANSGGDSVAFLTSDTYGIKKLVAEGGYGGFPGHGLFRPSQWPNNNRPWQFNILGLYGLDRGANLFGWPIFDDNGQACPWITSNYQSHPGASHIQKVNVNYDEILIGGPGGHGIAMTMQGAERFFNYAPDLPWNLSNSFPHESNNLSKPWGSDGRRTKQYVGLEYIGYDNPSDYAPTGGGGGNGAILPIIKQREQFILNNPGLDTDSIETFNDPNSGWGGKGGFYFTQDTTIGLGGKNKSKSIIFDDIYLGEGGNGGNSFVYPPNSLTITQPTTGSSYGGGGGGGASRFFDLASDPTAIGQDGADGGDGVVIIIVEN